MKYMSLGILIMLACASAPLTAGDAYAADAANPSPLDPFRFMVGEWDCTGQVYAHGTVLARPTRARVHGEEAAGGHWVLFRYDEIQTAENPRPFHIDQYFGYDPATKQYVSVAVDVGGYFAETGSGWSGDSITFDESADGKVIGHDTFTKKGQDEISHSGTDMDKEGKWIKTDEETCHRSK